LLCPINVREKLRDNQEWTIQRNWQYWVYKTQDEEKKTNKKPTTKKPNKTQHRKLKR
jgi:hypothetical protein